MTYPNLPKEIELYALCNNEGFGLDFENDKVHIGHLYKVVRFVKSDRFFPYGVIVSDYKGNELKQTFYVQRFSFIKHFLN